MSQKTSLSACKNFFDRPAGLLKLLRRPGKTKWFFLLLSTFLVVASQAQVKHLGLPLINNFPRTVYNASTQNWAITQADNGFMYFGNNDGLLEFDGQHWSLYRVPNNSIVRSVLVSGDTIYTGAYEELGYFAPQTDGRWKYHSLIHLVPEEFRSFDEVWKIFRSPSGIVFQTFRLLMIYDGRQMRLISPRSLYGHAYQAGNEIYISDASAGLYRLINHRLELVSADERFRKLELRCLLPLSEGRLLAGFVGEGMFVLEKGELKPWNTVVNQELKRNIVFSGVRLQNGLLAFGTIQNGVYIADEQGKVFQHVNRYKGLLNNTVLSLAEDRDGNLWLGLDNGIDHLEINSPFSIFDHTFHIESTYASVVHQGYLYVGTNQGLFYAPFDDLDNRQKLGTDFKLIPGTEGQVWSLTVVSDKLLCGHNFGLFQIEGEKATRLADDRGYWNVYAWDKNADTLLCGTYNGLTVMLRQGNSWRYGWKVKSFAESSRSFVREGNSIWIAHGYRGIFRVVLDPALQTALNTRLYYNERGLPPELPYTVFSFDNQVVFSTESGFLKFDGTKDAFLPEPRLNRIFGNRRINHIISDKAGNYWYFHQGRLGLMRLLEDGNYNDITSPFDRINDMIIISYENIHVFDGQNVFIGTKNGLLHYDPSFRRKQPVGRRIFLREMNFTGNNNEKTAFFNLDSRRAEHLFNQGQIEIPYKLNDVNLRFASPFFEAGGAVLFSFRLRGFENNWSAWSRLTFKEYTNLPEGKYVFELRVQYPGSQEDEVYAFPFEIRPPFYRTTTAYVIYVLMLILIVVGNVVLLQKRIARSVQEAREKHEKELQEQERVFREQALLAEKEIVNLRNEALQNEVAHKNKELANTTLHLIHKNKILNAIKAGLMQINDQSLSARKKDELDTLIGRINRELKNERFQKLFDETFDQVHDDFLSRLKAQHPDLTPRELRLCALLRMNLSTKEIAPLMNISVRGVEIGRYRLRKKLNLERDENLIDYLIKF
ncbi:MAG: hypothetical protein IPM52_05000 [Bacteroidetes bacterium]|nr:hypothetical protein [Bacteroidota bacterium]